MLNIPELNIVASNITAIRLMTEEDIEANNIVNNWKKTKMYFNAEQSQIAQDIASPNRLKVNIRMDWICEKIRIALIFVFVFLD